MHYFAMYIRAAKQQRSPQHVNYTLSSKLAKSITYVINFFKLNLSEAISLSDLYAHHAIKMLVD